MYIITANGDIAYIDISKFTNDVDLHSFLWRVQFDVEFSKQVDFIQKYVENVF